MGCVSSKSFRPHPSRVGCYSPLSCYDSTNQHVERDDGEYIATVTWTPIPYEELNPETYKGSFLFMGSRYKHYKIINPPAELDDSFAFTSHLDAKHKEAWAGTKLRMHEEERKRLLMHDSSEGYPWSCNTSMRHDVEVIDTWVLMEDLEGSAKDASSSLHSRNYSKFSTPDKHIPFNKLQGSISDPMGEIGTPVWKKYYMQEDEFVSMGFSLDQNVHTPPMGSSFRESPRRVHTPPIGSPFSGSQRLTHTPLAGSPFSRSLRKASSRGSLIEIDDARSFSSIELLDASTTGLKFLLSSKNSSFHPSPVTQSEGSHSASRQSFDGNTRSLHNGNASFDRRYAHLCVYFDDTKSPYRSSNTTRHTSKKPSTESVYECGSPLFDPSLMAAFEQALKTTAEAANYDEWLRLSMDESTVPSLSSADTRASFDMTSDAESLPSWQKREKSSSKVMLIDNAEVKSKRDLASYDLKCPPRGEGKIVLYVTSLRGIRKTYEECCDLRYILRGLGARVDERDVWMHSNFKSELMDVLRGTTEGMPLQVPQLFIKGRYIGGAEEVKELHEEGILACLMDGLALGVIHNVCDGCGDARFLPCFTCSGSRKVLSEDDEVSQCRDCNENGLIMCPMCIM